jgi:hypothetical protein
MDDFCSQRATAECQVAARCGGTLTKDDCQNQRKAVCLSWVSIVQQNPRVFTPGNIGACVSMATSIYAKTSPITPTDLANLDDACNYVFQGNVAMLGSCTVKFDCAQKQICDKGKCAAQMVKGATAQCSDIGAVCTTGSYCKMDAANLTYQCTAKATTGMSCADGTPCVENLRCAAATGTCTDRVPLAGTCTSSSDCATTAPYCDTFASNTCDMGLLFAPGSASCSGFANSGVTAGLNPTTSGPGTGGAGGGGMGGTAGSDSGAGGAGGSSADAASGG